MANKGASKRLINKYCLLLSLESVSLVVKITVCRILLGSESECGGSSLTSSTRLILKRSLYRSYHCGGVTFRLLVGCPYSSTTFASMMLKICSGLTLPQVSHCPRLLSTWWVDFLK